MTSLGKRLNEHELMRQMSRAHACSPLLMTFRILALICAGLICAAPVSAAGLSDAQQYELSLSKGLVKFAAGDYSQAETLFRQALQVRPGDPDATEHLGQTLIRLKRYEEAESLLRKVTEQRP